MPPTNKAFSIIMTQPRARNLRSIFLQSQILVSLVVLSIVTAVLAVLLLSLVNVFNHRRILEFAQSIESQARIVKTLSHLQHSTTQLVHTGQIRGIIVYNKTSKKIIAASNVTSLEKSEHWLVTDESIARAVKRSLTHGEFGTHTYDVGGGGKLQFYHLAQLYQITKPTLYLAPNGLPHTGINLSKNPSFR